ncbi:hypothetical protein GR927_12770 [Mycolicibacterium sp. 3033]|nr:hypothetical protein [Mycolicibacterium aurantiacum]
MDANERIALDDWADQDLLTKSEAAERLVAEIDETVAKIEAGQGSEMLERRLAGMREALANFRGEDG